MTTAVRYWRVAFRTVIHNTYYEQTAFNTLQLYNAAGTHVSSTATLTTDGSLVAGNALSALVDNNATTTTAFSFENVYQNWRQVTFDFGSGNTVLVDHVLVNVNSGNFVGGWTNIATTMDFLVYSSPDNITWTPQAFAYRPATTAGTDFRFAATTVSSLYPFPPRENLGGTGGIYGIVSEDGVALPNRPVLLLERDTFYKVGYTTTDENGGYAFNGLNEQREFTVMSVDPSGPPYKNALIWDRIQPINTKGNQLPASAFWARRTREASLGTVLSINNYLDGPTYDFFQANALGNGEYFYAADMTGYSGFGFYPDSSVGGAIKYLKSNRTAGNNGWGLSCYFDTGQFVPNASGATGNYANLTFEYIFKAPSSGESSLIMVYSGNRDSDDRLAGGNDNYQGYYGTGAGPTLEVTTSAMNVRFPLGAKNRSTIRATAPVVQGQIYHVMITYVQDTSIKLYINGALTSTVNISGAGRIWVHNSSGRDSDNWDSVYVSAVVDAAARRLSMFTVHGAGAHSIASNSDTRRTNGPGWGGGFGMSALYGRTFTDAEVASFYDSFANWETHTVLPTQSGYMAEVEADNPNAYFRLNELGATAKPTNTFGTKGHYGFFEAGTAFGATGFVSGSTAITTSLGAPVVYYVAPSTTFSAELFCRPTSITGTQRLFLSRIYNSQAPIYLSMVSGALSLSITDVTNTVTTFALGQSLVANTAYHLVVTYDPWDTKQLKLYVNGALVSTTTASTIPTVYAQQYWLGIGCNPSGTAPTISDRFQGQIGEFALYNYVLPAARVLAHYDARNA